MCTMDAQCSLISSEVDVPIRVCPINTVYEAVVLQGKRLLCGNLIEEGGYYKSNRLPRSDPAAHLDTIFILRGPSESYRITITIPFCI